MIDEIYVVKRVEYSGGKIHGMTTEGNVASTLLCFMVKSLACKFMDVVAIYPMSKLTAEKQYECYKEVNKLLSSVSLTTAAISVDNASTNRRFYTDFLCGGELRTHIVDPVTSLPTFLIIDPTHDLKNLYNNFQARKKFVCPPMGSDLPNGCSANFQHIADLYNKEEGMSLKKAHRLKQSTLQPKSIEKTSVKLAVSVFCESTRDALEFYSKYENQPDWSETANFLSIVIKLWNVLNVKTCSKGSRKRDETMDPIRNSWDWQLGYLREFADFLERWETSKKPGLTRETFLALRHTCRAVAECVEWLLNTRGFEFVLLGYLQSDPIEKRFGWLRQMSGANYFISMKQVVDNDKKIRTLSLLKSTELNFTVIDSSTNNDDSRQPDLNADDRTADAIVDTLTLSDDFKPNANDSAILFYVSGYIVKSVMRSSHCDECRNMIVDDDDLDSLKIDSEHEYAAATFFDAVNRGGLKKPTEFTFMTVACCWRIFQEIRANDDLTKKLLAADCHRRLFLKIFERLSGSPLYEDFTPQICFCTGGHDFTTPIVFKFFNCVAKNFVNKLTSDASVKSDSSQNSSKRRKIQKLSSESKCS